MLWLLFLHIGSLVTWAAALCILLLLIPRASSVGPQISKKSDSLERLWFTLLASPAGLLTIVSGTAIFAFDDNLDRWLLLKLTVVTALVVCHVTAGLLILYSHRPAAKSVAGKSYGLLGIVLLLLSSIIVLVLLKPQLEALRWFAS
ncbi:hypothetical protein VT06_08100 [Arsukibacterium sp. MJ3]|uniref:CopD family protein n=1 Tax=Arsukibacterium sp. MJ3 TaxID=1632859 RepID=UPI000627412E|nr:CopD family protein [Arsukibacterium sp. MJ3]KKO49196.1 hypothetical protein VT06_08100 [Arsukibacterium sp. MJ3]